MLRPSAGAQRGFSVPRSRVSVLFWYPRLIVSDEACGHFPATHQENGRPERRWVATVKPASATSARPEEMAETACGYVQASVRGVQR